uniref:Thyroxine-binding globulin n=1 Tax=Gouania willdenowi TaxID=441366 RepID=A0A8C5DP40_GOUWI
MLCNLNEPNCTFVLLSQLSMMHAAVSVWILLAVICVGRGHQHEGHDTDMQEPDVQNTDVQNTDVQNTDVQKTDVQDTAVDSSVSLVSSANKQFAFHLYKKLAAHADNQGKNIFFSPLSVSVALASLSVGARGETHKQLFDGLGFNNSQLTQTEVNRVFHTLMEKNNEASQDSIEGTAVFVDQRFKPHADFLDTLKNSYFADGFNVDFTKTKDSANTINTYVSDKTNGKIEKLVESLDPSTVMYLVSYIYFKGKWATPFEPKLTKQDMFQVDQNSKVMVQMMNREGNFHTYYDRDLSTSILHLPFNSSYSMLLLLPDDMATLENAICPSHVTKWLKWMNARRFDVSIPKFSIKTSYNLNEVLTEMGMTDMFGDRADLSGISEGQKLAVSDVVHKATLDVDEAGATATAATGIGITLLSFQHVPVLKFNRPFMVVITERNAGSILFVGKINNPVAE